MEKKGKLIHIGRIQSARPEPIYLFLRQVTLHQYTWFKEEADRELETPVWGSSIEEALRLAHQFWKQADFRTLICGFRYTLPERDEHGTNALFCQMAASYGSMTGVYFDEELGHNCVVYNPSAEARTLLSQLQSAARL